MKGKEALVLYATTVVSPQLKDGIRRTQTRWSPDQTVLTIRMTISKRDHRRVMGGTDDSQSLANLTGALLDRLAQERYGGGCRLLLRAGSVSA